MHATIPNVLQDLRFALRQLRRAPAFTLTAVLTLALGIGATTAIFSLLDQALLRSLPVREPASLVILEGTGKMWQGHSSSHGGDPEAYFSVPMYRDLRDQNHVFSGLLATAPADINLTHANTSEAARTELVSGNYFAVLGVAPALGRLLTPADDAAPNSEPRRRPLLRLLARPPRRRPRRHQLHRRHQRPPLPDPRRRRPPLPLRHLGRNARALRAHVHARRDHPRPGKRLSDHTDKWINILGRLAPGTSRAHAEAAMNPLWHALRAEELKALGHRSQHFTDDFLTNSRMKLVAGAKGFSYQRDSFEAPLLAVMAMALLVLLIASTNVASLLLVRSAARVREFSLRFALGAATGRIVAQLLLEGLLIGIAGGLTGMALAPIAIRTLIHQLAGDQTQIAFSPAIDLRLLAFSFLASVAVSLLFSLAPTLQLRRPDLTLALRQTSGTPTGGLLSLRRLIVALQIGLSVLLLVGAGLFVRTMQKLRSVDVGFNTTHLVTFGINPKLAGYAPAAIPPLQQRAIETLAALPGVQVVGASTLAQLAGDNHGGNVTITGFTPPADDQFDVEKEWVSPNYFHALEMPLLTGRAFTDADTGTGQKVAVVNQAFVQHFCAGNIPSCLGRQMADGAGNKIQLNTEIVGVVRDSKHSGMRSDVDPTVFQPLQQNPSPAGLHLYLRTATPPAQLLPTIRRMMGQLDPALALSDLRTMDEQIDDSLSNERLISLLATSFGLLATLLAGVGLYGVLAFTTAQRTREIGIRIALGSSRLAVSRLVLSDVLRLAGLGVAVALPVAFGLGRLLRAQLFGVSPADPLTLVAAVLTIALTALTAALIPARRAAAVDPTTALRTE